MKSILFFVSWFQQDRPIAFFDLESTGANRDIDRVIEVAILRVEPDGAETEFRSLVNPQIPIPPESTRIHRIGDDDVADAPTFDAIAPRILQLLAGADLSGYNIARFDIRMLSAELRRCGQTFPLEGRRIIDPMVIFHDRNPRTLSAAYRRYTGRDLENAHSALADCRAAREILAAQLAEHEDLPRDADALHAVCNKPRPDAIDPEGRLVLRYGKPALGFGKHAGRSLEEMARSDRSYLEWWLKTDDIPPAAATAVRAALAAADGAEKTGRSRTERRPPPPEAPERRKG